MNLQSLHLSSEKHVCIPQPETSIYMSNYYYDILLSWEQSFYCLQHLFYGFLMKEKKK